MKIACYKYRTNGNYYQNGKKIEPSAEQKLLFSIYGGKDTGISYQADPYYEFMKSVIVNDTKKEFIKIFELQSEYDKIEIYPDNKADLLCDRIIIN